MSANVNPQSTPSGMVKVAKILHLALLVGQVLFAGVTLFITQSTHAQQTDQVFIYLVPLLAISCFALGNFLYQKQLGMASSKKYLKDKLGGYLTAAIVRYALLEGASLFGIVVFMLTGNFVFLGVSGLIIFYFIIIRPTKDSISSALNLDSMEQAELG